MLAAAHENAYTFHDASNALQNPDIVKMNYVPCDTLACLRRNSQKMRVKDKSQLLIMKHYIYAFVCNQDTQ